MTYSEGIRVLEAENRELKVRPGVFLLLNEADVLYRVLENPEEAEGIARLYGLGAFSVFEVVRDHKGSWALEVVRPEGGASA